MGLKPRRTAVGSSFKSYLREEGIEDEVRAAAEYLLREPCRRCLALVLSGTIRRETLQPLYGDARDALAIDGSGPCCRDCAAADTLMRIGQGHPDFAATRIATGNCRQESLRLPGVPIGYVKMRIMRPSEPGDLDRHYKWLNRVLPVDDAGHLIPGPYIR